MLKYGDVNPLAVHGIRELSWLTPQCEVVTGEFTGDLKKISNWVYENTVGRFYLATCVKNSKNMVVIGFENPSEASYFVLMDPLKWLSEN
jgi:hypothetical protein